MNPGILYISYDGMLEPLGQSQVLAYLRELAPEYRIHLLSFEKPEDWVDSSVRERLRARIASDGIAWTPLRYHRRPTAPATAYDIAQGAATGLWLARRHRLEIVHARSYVAGLMALAVKRAIGARFLFDMRGFWADERVDGGLWPAGGRLYRGAKAAERALLRAADHVVTLTQASVAEIEGFPSLAARVPPITVIPTCADLDHFQPKARVEAGPFVLGHAGAVGTWYLFDELIAAFRLLRERRPDARLLIVNRGEHDFIRRSLGADGIAPDAVEVTGAEYRDMPAMLARMTAGSAIIKPAYSKIASAPTKLAEYLGCGLPCLGNRGVGDVERVLEGDRVGVAIQSFTPPARADAVDRLLKLTQETGMAERCIAVAHRRFSLKEGVRGYRQVYRSLRESDRSKME